MKNKFKKDDIAVVLFHDHGSRYMGKMFNDEWMTDRGFLTEEKITAIKLIERHKDKRLVTVKESETIHEAVKKMRKYNISQVPVTNGDEGKYIGSLNDTEVFMKLIENPKLGEEKVARVVQAPFPLVSPEASLEEVSQLITQENHAVLVKDALGEMHIITRQDIVEALC
jgi:cystathionine beta-synthase